jgi:hypothetical protein
MMLRMEGLLGSVWPGLPTRQRDCHRRPGSADLGEGVGAAVDGQKIGLTAINLK